MGFPTKNDDFGGVLGVPPFKEAPISTLQRTNIYPTWERGKKKGKPSTQKCRLKRGDVSCVYGGTSTGYLDFV